MAKVESPQGQRQLRVGEQIRHILAKRLRECFFNDPNLAKASEITVTEVRISPDLKQATAYILPLGGADVHVLVPALNKVSAFFRKELAKEMQLRHVPKVRFKEDTSFEHSSHIESLLASERVRRDTRLEETPKDDVQKTV